MSNITSDGSQLTYDATGQQTSARYNVTGGWDIRQSYDGDRQRVKKVEGGQTTYYLRSTVLGGQVVAEYNQSGAWTRGYVYDGSGQLLAMQAGGVQWVHTDPVTKSKRVTNRQGEFLTAIDVDPWGGETSRMYNGGALARRYTTYERDGNGRDQAMARSYSGWFSRFDQPDPSDGSYDLTNPQSFNRYAYVGNDPVNFTDPTGLEEDEVVRVYTWAPAWNWRQLSGGRSGGVWFARMYRREDPRGVGSEPTNTGQPRPTGDCAKFADIVEGIANETIGSRPDTPGLDVQVFMNRLATTFTEFSAARLGAVLGAGTIEPVNTGQQRFGSSGFASSYFEPDANQVRHTVGGLVAGYVGISLGRMNARENPQDRVHGVPDINLNGQTVPMGVRLGATGYEAIGLNRRGISTGAEAAMGLADWIRNTLCGN